jgi:predicted transcriptional regulator
MPTTKHRIAANLNDAEFSELAAMAEKYDVSLSWLSRKAILEFIDRYQAEQLQLPLRQPGRTASPGRNVTA